MDDNESCLGTILSLLLTPLGVLVNGFTLSVLWGWFVVPLGGPDIGIAEAFGLSLVATLLVGPALPAITYLLDRQGLESGAKRSAASFLINAILNGFMLLSGWVVVQFV